MEEAKPWKTDPEPNVRQRRFVSELLRGKNQSQAAVSAGYRADYAKDLMKLPQVKNLLDKAMRDAGIDDLLIARKLREGLDAKTPPRKEGGKQYADQFVRKQFLDVIFKLRGDYAPERTENVQKMITVTIDKGWLEALKDSGFLKNNEVEVLEAEIVKTEGTEEIRELSAGQEGA